VHAPLQATTAWLNKQAPLSAFTTSAGLIYQNATQRRTYAAMVAQMDDAVVSARPVAKRSSSPGCVFTPLATAAC